MAVLVVSNLSKSFPTGDGDSVVTAVDDVSISVEVGEFVTIVGPSGSGKSTLLYCLSGLMDFDTGSVRVDDVDLAALSRNGVAKLRRDKLGFVFQNYNLIPYLSVRENVSITARLAGRQVSDTTVSGTLRRLGIEEEAKKNPGALSGGQRQRAAITRTLVSKPAILFADEPTGALDTASGEIVADLLREQSRSGSAVVLVTHNLELAAGSDRVIVLRDGRLDAELRNATAVQILDAMTHGDSAAGGQR